MAVCASRETTSVMGVVEIASGWTKICMCRIVRVVPSATYLGRVLAVLGCGGILGDHEGECLDDVIAHGSA